MMDFILEYLWFFIIYAFLGWCVEVAFHVVTSGKFVNRGFLNGPVCPIYGFGMIILVFCLQSLSENFFLLFLGAFFLTSTLEFITGFVLEKVFNDKWWDYNNMPFNIKGYICLSFSIIWGLAGVFMIDIIHPSIAKFVSILDNKIGNTILIFIIAYFITDFIITILGIMEIKKYMRIREEIAEKLRSYSEDVGENIYKGMTLAIKTKDTMKNKLAEQKVDFEDALDERKIYIEELRAKYEKLLKEKNFVHRRLEKAFPNIKSKLSNQEHNKKNN